MRSDPNFGTPKLSFSAFTKAMPIFEKRWMRARRATLPRAWFGRNLDVIRGSRNLRAPATYNHNGIICKSIESLSKFDFATKSDLESLRQSNSDRSTAKICGGPFRPEVGDNTF